MATIPYSGVLIDIDAYANTPLMSIPPGTQSFSPGGDYYFSNSGDRLNIYSVDLKSQHRHIGTAYSSPEDRYIVTISDEGQILSIKGGTHGTSNVKIISESEATSFGLISTPDEPKPKEEPNWIAEAFI